MPKPRFTIQKVFIVSCPDCGETCTASTWRDARSWVPKHRKTCPTYQAFLKSVKIGRPKTERQAITCPVCQESRYMSQGHIKQSIKRNLAHPERFGMHRSCRMKVVKPALKYDK